jgi:hypothetical protein
MQKKKNKSRVGAKAQFDSSPESISAYLEKLLKSVYAKENTKIERAVRSSYCDALWILENTRIELSTTGFLPSRYKIILRPILLCAFALFNHEEEKVDLNEIGTSFRTTNKLKLLRDACRGAFEFIEYQNKFSLLSLDEMPEGVLETMLVLLQEPGGDEQIEQALHFLDLALHVLKEYLRSGDGLRM